MKHHVWMLVACLLPLLLILTLPSIGIQSNALLALLLVGCFAMHLLMMKGHGGDEKGEENNHDKQD